MSHAAPGANGLPEADGADGAGGAHGAAPGCCSPDRVGGGPGDSSAIGSSERSTLGPTAVADGLVAIRASSFVMGTDDPSGDRDDGEGPSHLVELAAFEIARHTVTNDEFDAFVTATDHLTVAEEFGDSFVFAGLLPDDFPPTRGVVAAPWWRQVEGADWRHPEGPHSDLRGRGRHPVVHVSWTDAMAFCAWSQTRLPTEAEWECAARGGRAGTHFPWGDDLEPGGTHLMNVFQGQFPSGDTGDDGFVGLCPVGTYPPNGFGLYEMTGNVWEWCSDWFDASYYSCSPTRAPRGPDGGERRVMRGGSYLCHESYCRRYRVDARSSSTPDSTAGNIGFRVAR